MRSAQPSVKHGASCNCQAARAGFGIAVLPHVVAHPHVADGLLHAVLPSWKTRPVPVYAVTTTRLLPAKTQVFLDFLAEKLRAWHTPE